MNAQSEKPSGALDVLIGLRLTIVRRAADMLVLHFGEIRTHESGEGTVGAYALHIQCPWRIDASADIAVGQTDLWGYVGPGERPSDWTYEDGNSFQDRVFDELIGHYGKVTRSWYNMRDSFVVLDTYLRLHGDITVFFTNGYTLRVFPDSGRREAWRFFAPGDAKHLIFPER